MLRMSLKDTCCQFSPTLSSSPSQCCAHILHTVGLGSFLFMRGKFLLRCIPRSTVRNKIIWTQNVYYPSTLFSVYLFFISVSGINSFLLVKDILHSLQQRHGSFSTRSRLIQVNNINRDKKSPSSIHYYVIGLYY